MKGLLISMIAAAAVMFSLRSVAQEHAVALPGTTADRGTIESSNQTESSNSKAQENNTAEHDDTLYRGKTSESENPMLRDEGPLHFKQRPREKVQKVDSLKDLRTSGADSTFQSSLLHNSVTSIQDVSAKPVEGTQIQDSHAAGYKRHQVFPAPNDSVKTGVAEAKTDSSPSPSPSASASPTPGH
jgi:hypothetical protein